MPKHSGIGLSRLSLGLIRLSAWVLVAAIVVVTLVPIGARPVVTPNFHIERFVAFSACGCLLALGYRHRWAWVLFVCVALAGGLEAAQTLTATRHGIFGDFLLKAFAGLAGVAVGCVAAAAWARRPTGRRRR